MASQQQLKSRIRSVKSTKQITKAMQMVAASKMRRAQDATKATASYTETARSILAHLAKLGSTNGHAVFEARPIKNRLVILIASDRGLAGAYNANVLKNYLHGVIADDKNGVHTSTIAIGRKATQFVTRLKNDEVVGVYENLPERLEGHELHAVLDTAYTQFAEGSVDAVDLVYTEFISSVVQEVKTERLLPAGLAKASEDDVPTEALFEPDTETVLEAVVYRLLLAQLAQALLDARASEHSMRMMAMKNATDNAGKLIDELQLIYNKARQAAITQEISEIVAGAQAVE